MCSPDIVQALQQMQQANGQPAQDLGNANPAQIYQAYANQAPQTTEPQSYSYRSMLSPADIIGSMNAGRQGNPAPVTPQVFRTRTGAQPGAGGGTGSGSSAEQKHTFARDAAPTTPTTPTTPDPTGVDQYKVAGAPYFSAPGVGPNPAAPEGNLWQFAQKYGTVDPKTGLQRVRLPTDAIGYYDPFTGKFVLDDGKDNETGD